MLYVLGSRSQVQYANTHVMKARLAIDLEYRAYIYAFSVKSVDLKTI